MAITEYRSDVLGVDLNTLTSYTTDELTDLLEEKLCDMSEEDRLAYQESLETELSEISDNVDSDLHDATNSYEDAVDEENYGDSYDYNLEVTELTALQTLLDEFDDATTDALAYCNLTEVRTAEDYSITYDTGNADTILDGDTISVEAITGAEAGTVTNGTLDANGDVIAGTQQVTDSEGNLVLVDADIDGIADQDFNGDSVIDYNDLIYQLNTTDPTTNGQNIFLDINSGDTLSFESYDELTDTVQFLITTAAGKEIHIKLTGSANIIATGTDYIQGLSSGNFAAISGWPVPVLKRFWDGTTNPLSLYEQANPVTDVGLEERLAACPGYTDSVNDVTDSVALMTTYIAESNALSSTGSVSVPADMEESVTNIINMFYDTMLINSDSLYDSTEMWTQIYNYLDTTYGTGNSSAKSAVMGTFLYIISKNDPTHFASDLIATQIQSLEAIVNYNSYDATDDTNMGTFEKFITTILEMQSGGIGQYSGELGPASMMTNGLAYSSVEGQDGVWADNDENVKALEWYQTLVNDQGMGIGADVLEAYGREQGIIEADEQLDSGNVDPNTYDVSSLAPVASDFGADMKTYIDQSDVDTVWDDINAPDYQLELSSIIDAFVAALQSDPAMTLDGVCDTVLNAISSCGYTHQNDLAAGFMLCLEKASKENPSLQMAKLFFGNGSFVSGLWDMVDHDIPDLMWDVKPERFDDAEALKNKYT